MRNCDECNYCCNGHLGGEVNGVAFGNLKACQHLNGNCQIYDDRPEMCRTYFCAWAQGLFPESMRPDKVGVVISVENKSGAQYLHAVSAGAIPADVDNEINRFVDANNTFCIKTRVIPIKQVKVE